MISLGSLGPSVNDNQGELGSLSSQELSARNPPLAEEWDKGSTISGDKGSTVSGDKGCYLLVDCFVATHGVDNICLKQKHIGHNSIGCNLKGSPFAKEPRAGYTVRWVQMELRSPATRIRLQPVS